MFSKNSGLAAALLAAPAVHAHYIFSQLIVNNQTVGSDYSYIRQNTNTYMPSYAADIINSEDLRCNAGAGSAFSETYDVKAGDTIGFKLSFDELIEHPGPGFVYMSKAPGDVGSYVGDGDWFKVWEGGANGAANVDTNWVTWQKDRIEFAIPADIPDGDYLVRPEHIAIHENHVGKAQFYMECAQLRISGGGSGTPSPLVKIPGLYATDDPGFTYSIWTGSDPGYTMPGPAVWGGSANANTTNTGAASGTASTDSSANAPSGFSFGQWNSRVKGRRAA
ncbi:lytic polysaccharide monooxygenase [Zasmidium cellare ATCC 36951]|uniref:AA9 family lytic polysaccharide monooxygenase n=1 Tax=Zasmidium cellare ATCC 36951 TaxID=1080233 RepID=A0A6A6BYA5_ZASCE|nr:lytic polysaccharide monooxygenase [Zasmidium cellare ATCC 36951]KAF2158509.1 lytic polysaccharide monooxygenase [Zasmidium cellare ATCC 36951]